MPFIRTRSLIRSSSQEGAPQKPPSDDPGATEPSSAKHTSNDSRDDATELDNGSVSTDATQEVFDSLSGRIEQVPPGQIAIAIQPKKTPQSLANRTNHLIPLRLPPAFSPPKRFSSRLVTMDHTSHCKPTEKQKEEEAILTPDSPNTSEPSSPIPPEQTTGHKRIHQDLQSSTSSMSSLSVLDPPAQPAPPQDSNQPHPDRQIPPQVFQYDHRSTSGQQHLEHPLPNNTSFTDHKTHMLAQPVHGSRTSLTPWSTPYS